MVCKARTIMSSMISIINRGLTLLLLAMVGIRRILLLHYPVATTLSGSRSRRRCVIIASSPLKSGSDWSLRTRSVRYFRARRKPSAFTRWLKRVNYYAFPSFLSSTWNSAKARRNRSLLLHVITPVHSVDVDAQCLCGSLVIGPPAGKMWTARRVKRAKLKTHSQ